MQCPAQYTLLALISSRKTKPALIRSVLSETPHRANYQCTLCLLWSSDDDRDDDREGAAGTGRANAGSSSIGEGSAVVG